MINPWIPRHPISHLCWLPYSPGTGSCSQQIDVHNTNPGESRAMPRFEHRAPQLNDEIRFGVTP